MSDSLGAVERVMGDSNKKQVLLELVRSIVVPTATVSAFGYYLGWCANTGYYLVFHLPASFISKSPVDMISSAWIDIVISCLYLVLAIIMDRLVNNWMDHLALSSIVIQRRLFLISMVFLFVSGVIGIYFLYLLIRTHQLLFAGVVGSAVFLFYISALIGKKIQEEPQGNPRIKKTASFFFPNYSIYLLITVLASILLLGRFTLSRGVNWARMDISNPRSLTKLVVYSENPLPINGTYNDSSKLYEYQDFRLIDSNDRYLYLIRFDQNGFTTYAVPRDKFSMYEFISQ